MKTLLTAAGILFGTAALATPVSSRFEASNLVQDITEERLSMAGPLFKGVESTFNQGDAWVEGFGYSAHMREESVSGAKAKNKGAGAVLGYDHVVAENFRIGLALAAEAGKSQTPGSSGEDIRNRSGSALLYGTWRGQKVNVIADIGYLAGRSELKDLSSVRESGGVFNTSVRFETSFDALGLNWVPYYGVRFMYLDNDEIKGVGAPADFKNAHIWQFPVGVNTGYNFTGDGGWRTRVGLDLAVIPTAGRKKVELTSASLSQDLRYANSLQFRGKFGVEAVMGSHAVNVGYRAGIAPRGSFEQDVTAGYRFMY